MLDASTVATQQASLESANIYEASQNKIYT